MEAGGKRPLIQTPSPFLSRCTKSLCDSYTVGELCKHSFREIQLVKLRNLVNKDFLLLGLFMCVCMPKWKCAQVCTLCSLIVNMTK